VDNRPWYGYLVAESDALLVLHQVSDRYELDGYVAFRRQQISEISEDFERADLIRSALRLKDLDPRCPRALELSSMSALMASAQAQFGVLVIAREGVSDDEVEVGRLRLESATHYVLRWLDINAHWTNDDRRFRFADVTRLEFGCEYEQTLMRVAEARDLDQGRGQAKSVD
jgi:hypothetical protein